MRYTVAIRRFILIGLLLLACTGLGLAQCVGNVCTSSTSVTITNGIPNHYPWTINVSGLTGSVSKVTLTLNTLSGFSNFNDLAFLVQSPGGLNLDFLSAGCGNGQPTGSFTLDDAALNFVPTGSCAGGGTFKPTDFFAGLDNFGAPGPAPVSLADSADSNSRQGGGIGTGTFANHFNALTGAALNGTWKLLIANQTTPNGAGVIASWTLTFTTTGAGAPTTTTLTAGTPNPSFTTGTASSVTFPAHVQKSDNSGPATSGTVTLHDTTTNSDLVTSPIDSSGNVNLIATIATQGAHDIYAIYNGAGAFAASTPSNHVTQTAVNHAVQNGTSFCNNGTITIPNGDLSGIAANPYPSDIILGGTEPTSPGIIQKVTVSLNNFTYGDPAALGFMLVAPSGNPGYAFMANAGGGLTVSGINLTLDDNAATALPLNMQLTTGSYKPASYICNPTCSANPDPYPLPAPQAFDSASPRGSTTFAQDFGGLGINGAWKLYISNRGSTGTPGTLGGWCLNFTLQQGAHGTQTVVTSSKNPATMTADTVTITANVTVTDGSGLPVNSGSVTFTDGVTTLAQNVAVSNGVASFMTSSLGEGTHHILASYGGTNVSPVFGVSSGSLNQRIDHATTETGTYSYCNTGSILVPGGTASMGPAAPYPSNIFVTGLPGTVKAVTVTLKQFSSFAPGLLDSLLVGPGGGNLDFFSRAGGVNPTGPFNITFDDTAPAGVGASIPNGGPYKPTSVGGPHVYSPCPQNAAGCQAPPVGPPAPAGPYTYAAPSGSSIFGNAGQAGVFGGTSASTFNGNGTWSLYQQDVVLEEQNDATIAGGWCVNFTENPPVLSIAKSHTAANFIQGQNGTYMVTVTNNGPGSTGSPATGGTPATVTDVLTSAPGLTVIAMSGTGWTCDTTTIPTCTSTDVIAAGATYPPITVTVGVFGNAASPQVNKASVLGGGSVGIVTSAGDSTVILPAPVLSIVKSHAGTFTQGQTSEWDLTVSNAMGSGHTAFTTTVSDTLPTGYTVQGFSTTSMTWTCSGAGTQTATCTSTQQIAGGSSFPAIQIIVNIPANSPASVTNTGKVFGGDDQVHTSLGTAASGLDTVTVVQVPASITITAGNNQLATINTAYAAALQVNVKDAGGVLIPNQSVTFAAPAAGANPTAFFPGPTNTATVSTANSGPTLGIATAPTPLTANGVSGPLMVTATAGTVIATFNLRNIVNTPPTADTVTGIVAGSLTQSLTFKYSSVNGFGYLTDLHALFNSSITATGGCWIDYNQPQNTFYLLSDGVTAAQSFLAGASTSISNGQCTLNGSGSSVSGSGNTLTLVLNVTFKAAFGSSHSIYMFAGDAGNMTSGWQLKGSTAGMPNVPPTADLVTGIKPGSLTQDTLALQYSSVNGAGYLMDTYALFNGSLSAPNSCLVLYDKTANGFYLMNDLGNALLGPLAQNAAGTLSNMQCTLNGTGSTVSLAGNALTMHLNVVFSASFGAAQTVFMYAADANGLNSGWQNRGSTGSATAPTADTVTGIAAGSLTQTLTFKYSSANGYQSLSDVYALFNSSLNGTGACWVFYDKAANGFYLVNDAGNGTLGPLAPGSAGTLVNSQCTLDGTGSSVSGSGNTRTMILSVTFTGSFGAGQNIFMYAADESGLNSGWQAKGSTAQSTPPTADSVTGMTNGSATQSLVFKYSSVNGYPYLGRLNALVNATLNGTGACWVFYDKPADSFSLLNDGGTAFLGPLTRGSAGTLTNSQCTLNGTGSTVTGAGTTSTMTLNLTFTGLHGAQNIFLYASDAGGMNSGWQNRGAVTLP